MEYEIIPAILVDTVEEFNERIEVAEDFAETVQWDIMDGQFVEQITFNQAEELEQVDTTLSLEAHLMVENPEEVFEELADAGIDRVIVHYESLDEPESVIEKMRSFDFEVGLAINPETEVQDIESLLPLLDMVLVMTVVPGASGQKFLEEELEKVKWLRKKAPQLHIGVDGGINQSTIVAAKKAGANRFGVNSAIFESPDPAHAFETLQSLIS